MKKVFILNKKERETPLGALEVFRRKKIRTDKKYENIKMTYAGRLDPMASGLLLILVGDEVKNKEKYLKLGKEYKFEILFGFATDTYDILGKVVHFDILQNIKISELGQEIKKNLKFFTNRWKQKYPAYSSRTWERTRAGERVAVREKGAEGEQLTFLRMKPTNGMKLLQNIERRIAKVVGDFRQKEILKVWRQNLFQYKKEKFIVGSFKIKCSSGTYVRGIANSLGDRIGISALAFSIKRTKIGKWGKM